MWKENNPTTARSWCINTNERDTKERKVRRATKSKEIEAQGVKKEEDETVLRWFGHAGTMKNNMGQLVGSGPVGGLRKSWIDSVNERLKMRRGFAARKISA